MGNILSTKKVKTRKPHVCFGCGRKFQEGTDMHKYFIVDDDGAWGSYLCRTCEEIYQNNGFTFGFGDLRSEALQIERERVVHEKINK